MSFSKMELSLMGACMVSAAAILGPLNSTPPTTAAPLELLDPLFVARSTCSAGQDHTSIKRPTAWMTIFSAGVAHSASNVPYLFDTLGDRTFPISTNVPETQQYFDQGLKWAYAFNHEEALRSFRYARELDPGCAMCAWGEALVLGPNINAPMAASAVAPAISATYDAVALSQDATAKEQSLITALSERYVHGVSGDRSDLDIAYAEAMGKVASLFPQDDDIAILHAEAMMTTQPWDYWASGGSEPKGYTAQSIETLETVLERSPDHPAAIHLYIHLVEASTNPERAEVHADRLGALMPGAGHLVHMPSHIYYRLGRFKDSIAANEDAVAADEAYFAKTTAPAFYRGSYYPHNLHFLMTSAQMAGDADLAIETADKLVLLIDDDIARQVPWVQAIKAAPFFAHAQFSEADVVLGLAEPDPDFTFVQAIRHYARAKAYAETGDFSAARRERSELVAIGHANDFRDLVDGGLPAPDILQIANHVLIGRIAQGEGDSMAAVEAYRAAVAVQSQLPYMEPPYWYYPVRQSLGVALLQAGMVDEAEQVLRTALVESPNNGWALFALEQVLLARGETKAASVVAEAFENAWIGDPNGKVLTLTRI